MPTENETYVNILCMHIGSIVHSLKAIPEDKWDWSPALPAPTPRLVAEHAWVWLVCDRQHLQEPNMALHAPVPEAPQEPEKMCEALQAESAAWKEALLRLTPEQFNEMRFQFGLSPFSVRQIIGHITQQVIYKSGQLSTLFFALGLDGEEKYSAPQPNTYYLIKTELMAHPLFGAIIRDDVEALQAILQTDAAAVNEQVAGQSALLLAVNRNHQQIVEILLDSGANPNTTDEMDNTGLIYAANYGSSDVARLLLKHGADPALTNKYGGTAIGLAKMRGHGEIAEMLA